MFEDDGLLSIRVFSADRRYLNNSESVSVEELSADSCPAEIGCSQNKYLPEKRKNVLV